MITALTNEELFTEVTSRLKASQERHTNEIKLLEEIKQLGARLNESERVKSDFLSNIRNELVNPLSAILGLSQAILRDPSPDQTRACARMMYGEAFDLDYQMRNLFAAAEIEAGSFHAVPSRSDAGAIVAHSVEAFGHSVQTKNLRVVFANRLDGQHVIIDPALFQLLFNNLLANAIEFSLPANEILIGLTFAEDTLRLTVKDFGIGIDMTDREKIFHRFRQLDSGTKKLHRGQGLGLSIVQECVQCMGATMQLDSARNRYTEFTLLFPSVASGHLPEGISTGGNDVLFDTEEVV
jgi:signal transduction histidine kinase